MSQTQRPDDRFAELNQPPLRSGVNAYRSDPLLVDLTSGLARTIRDDYDQIGRHVTSPEAQELARMANDHAPRLHTHGPRGERLDQVEYHPAWHALMRRSMQTGLHSSIWESVADARGHEYRVRATRLYLTAQLESGHLGPLSSTCASVAALMSAPRLQKQWAPKILARKYDSTVKPAQHKSAVTIGLGIAEKQAGSELSGLRAGAERVGEGIYRLSGHKWFLSAPMSDAFLMLARLRDGLACFLVPRVLEDGSANGLRLQRLKETLGNRSNASAEVEFSDAFGYLLGEQDAGQRTIQDVLTLTRLDGALASAGLMRASLAEAVHYGRKRQIAGKPLVDQPLMTRVLADMALDVAAATALSFRLADAFDRAGQSPVDAAFVRVMTPAVKYWTSKVAPALIGEAMECLGANGYVEDRPLARHYRDAPAYALWDGAGNAMALDLLRVVSRSRDAFEAVLAGIERDLGASGRRTVEVLRAAMALGLTDEGAARMLAEQLALAAAAAELVRLGAGKIGDAFVETRLAGAWRSTYGMLDARFDARYIVDLLYPASA